MSYDENRNRLTETTGAGTDTYLYHLNGGTGNTPVLSVLSEVQHAAGGTRDYLYGPAGHLNQGSVTSTTPPPPQPPVWRASPEDA